jgi:hypothetical protein
VVIYSLLYRKENIKKETGFVFAVIITTMPSETFVGIFADIGNRCRYQTRTFNEQSLAFLNRENYGDCSFPSAVFVSLHEPKPKEKDVISSGSGACGLR